MWVRSLGWEDPLEKEMATHSSVLAWRIPGREPTPPRSARVSPAPAALPARSQPQWRPREHNWDRPPPKAIAQSVPKGRQMLNNN